MIYHIGQRVTVNDNFGRRQGPFSGTVVGYDMCHNKLRLDRPNGVVDDEEAVRMLSEGWRILQVFVEMDDPALWESTERQKHPAIHCSRVKPVEVKTHPAPRKGERFVWNTLAKEFPQHYLAHLKTLRADPEAYDLLGNSLAGEYVAVFIGLSEEAELDAIMAARHGAICRGYKP